jgi:hypothetical protein
MNPIPISPSDLATLLFGSVNERNAHIDEATHHWLRRPGAPAMDMPSKIVPPWLAAEITKADPDGAWLHIQTVTAPHVTYHVLWERRHWLESNERVMQGFHSARTHREAFFTAKSEELAATTAHAARMSHMIRAITACGLPRIKATLFVEHAWRDAANEEAFRAKIEGIENLFGIVGIYQEPYETKQQDNQDNQVEQAQVGEDNPLTPQAGGEAEPPVIHLDRQAGPADRVAEGEASELRDGPHEHTRADGHTDSIVIPGDATSTESR